MSFRLLVAAIICLIYFSAHAEAYEKGLVFSSETEYKSFPTVQRYRSYLPESVDLSYRFPSVGHQGSQGSCVGWAVAYGARSYYEYAPNGTRLDSRSAFSPSFIYNQIKNSDKNCAIGTSIVDALNLVRDQGVPKISDFPYIETNCTNQPTADVKNRASQFRIKGWKTITDIESVKGELYRGNPVVVGMAVSSSFDNLRGKNIYTDERSESAGGHAMVITGYDDKRRAFKLFNSWGTSWGENGFGWVSYRAMTQRGREFFTMMVASTPVPQPNPAPVPRPTPEPPPAPEPPKVNPQELQRIAESVECGSIKTLVAEKGEVTLSGFAGEQSAIDAIVAKLMNLEGVRGVIGKVQTQPWPLCEAMKTLELTTRDPKRLSLSLAGQTTTEFHENAKLAFDIKLETKSAYLYVDYLQANGEAVTLERAQQVAGNKTLRLPPGGKRFVIQPPFGAELLVAIISPTPLLDEGVRYENDREYLSALRQALLGLSPAQRVQVISSTVSIKTLAR
jgi:hypothetical protein